MSTLKSKTKATSRPFVKIPDLELSVETNDKNQITCFNAVYNGRAVSIQVKDFDILQAWQKIEAFVIKQNKK